MLLPTATTDDDDDDVCRWRRSRADKACTRGVNVEAAVVRRVWVGQIIIMIVTDIPTYIHTYLGKLS